MKNLNLPSYFILLNSSAAENPCKKSKKNFFSYEKVIKWYFFPKKKLHINFIYGYHNNINPLKP